MSEQRPQQSAGGSRRIRLVALAVLVPVAAATLAGIFLLWPSGTPLPEQGEGPEQTEATVTAIERAACPEPQDLEGQPDSGSGGSDGPGCGTAELEIQGGPEAGSVVEAELSDAPGSTQVEEGDDVLVAAFENPQGIEYAIVDQQRGTDLLVLVAAFALAVVAFGRWRGLAALAGLGVSFAILLFFVVPGILDGRPPLLVAIVGASAIALSVLYLTHGPSVTTSVAVLGTLASLTLTGLLSALSVSALHLTGFSDDLATYVGTTFEINTAGLLLAGIVIGSLGVLDDVTVTQAATVQELARSRPEAGVWELYRAGTRVGRAHVASVVNTIVLAYAGTSLPLLIVVIAGGDALGEVVTDQVIAQEVVRSAVATLGLVAAVPITTVLAALAAHEVTGRTTPDA